MGFTDQVPFRVTADHLTQNWAGRGLMGLACGFCLRVPQEDDIWRWVYVEGRPNVFVCAEHNSEDVAERFRVRWDTVIKPILRRWGEC